MQGSWLNRQGTRACTLFMAGWGMGTEPFAGLVPDDRDCFLCYDYRDLALPDLSWIRKYEQIDLLAWSMGVWVAATTLVGHNHYFSSATALAGTLHPLDDRLGIPVTAWMEMERRLNQTKLEYFYASMFEKKDPRQRFLAHQPCRTLSSLQDELAALRSQVQAAGPGKDIFTHRIITRRDRIFPPRNQFRAWRRWPCESRPWPHFPFFENNIPASGYAS